MELFLLVLRNLLARPVRSLLTLLGVLVATASMVLFLSFGEGLRRALFQELSRVGPAIQVVPEGAEGFVFGALPEIPPETLKALEEAGKALGVRAVVPTLFLTRGGFDPSTSFLFQGLPEGTPPDLLYPGLKAKEGRLTPSEKGAVVGAKVAERSGLALGSVLRLTPRLELRVEGVLEATGGLADNLIFVPLRAIQEALGTENVTAVLVALSPGQKAEAVARALEEVWGRPPVYTREGGTSPVVAELKETLGAPIVLLGLGLPDDNLHAPNEKLDLVNLEKGVEVIRRFHRLLAG